MLMIWHSVRWDPDGDDNYNNDDSCEYISNSWFHPSLIPPHSHDFSIH